MVKISLDRSTARAIEQIISDVIRRFQPRGPEALIHTGAIAAKDLRLVVPKLASVPDEAAVIIEGLPDPERNVERARFFSSAVGFAMGIGLPYQWREQAPDVFQEVRPKPDAARNSNGSAEPFGLHSDDAIVHPAGRPKWITLFGVENCGRAATGIALIDQAVSRLPRSVIGWALEPNFRVRVPASFGIEEVYSIPLSLLRQTDKGYEVSYPTYATKPAKEGDERAITVIHALREAAQEVVEWVVLEPGSLLVFNNARCLHCRSAITGHRVLVRAYWGEVENLDFLRQRAPCDSPWLFNAASILQTL